MSRILAKSTLTVSLVALLVLALALPAEAGSINKSVSIDAGATSNGASSVNGSIAVGAGALVSGDLDTVNGRIRVGADAKVEDVSTVNGSLRIESGASTESLSTVNGGIDIDANVTVKGEVEAVNGEIDIDEGSTVSRDVSNVNGAIELHACMVDGDVSTVSGDIELSGAAEVKGNIIVEKPNSWGWSEKKSRVPEIVIGPGSKVRGEIRVERIVKLYISETAEVGGVTGAMSLDDAIRFSGTRP